MGATYSEYCQCYCLKLCEFGQRFRCRHPCCMRYCEPCCHCGDCCDVDDNLPFVEENEEASRGGEDGFVYPNGDRYVGEWHNKKRHGYGELVRKDGTRLKGFFVEDQFVGERPPDATSAGTHASEEEDKSSKSIIQTEPTISYRKTPSAKSEDDQEELLLDT